MFVEENRAYTTRTSRDGIHGCLCIFALFVGALTRTLF